MADIIEVNINTLNSDIGNMQSELNGLRSEMKKAFTAVAELDRMWNGPANDAFNKAFQDDNQSMEEMCKIVDRLIEYMTNAREEYRKCENAVSAEIDAIRI